MGLPQYRCQHTIHSRRTFKGVIHGFYRGYIGFRFSGLGFRFSQNWGCPFGPNNRDYSLRSSNERKFT